MVLSGLVAGPLSRLPPRPGESGQIRNRNSPQYLQLSYVNFPPVKFQILTLQKVKLSTAKTPRSKTLRSTKTLFYTRTRTLFPYLTIWGGPAHVTVTMAATVADPAAAAVRRTGQRPYC